LNQKVEDGFVELESKAQINRIPEKSVSISKYGIRLGKALRSGVTRAKLEWNAKAMVLRITPAKEGKKFSKGGATTRPKELKEVKVGIYATTVDEQKRIIVTLK